MTDNSQPDDDHDDGYYADERSAMLAILERTVSAQLVYEKPAVVQPTSELHPTKKQRRAMRKREEGKVENEHEDQVTHTAFRLFTTEEGKVPLVRLTSPEAVYNGPGKGRVLDVANEDPEVVQERQRRIQETAVDAEWIHLTSSPDHWPNFAEYYALRQ